MTLLKAYKTEINPTDEQKNIIDRTIGTCRFIYNFYIEVNDESLPGGNGFISGGAFSKWLNNEYIPNSPDKAWIKDVSSKSVKQAIMNGQSAYLNFFKARKQPDYIPYSIAQIETGKPLTYYDMQGHPKHKKKNTDEPKMYFVKTDASVIIPCERHRIKIPTLGWVRLKEKGYLPTRAIIRSGSVSKHADRYYVPVLVDEEPQETTPTERDGIGIDLGIKTFATCSDEVSYDNINQ